MLEGWRQLRALYLQFLRDTKSPDITVIEPLTTKEFAIYFSRVAQCPPPEFPPKETTRPANVIPFPPELFPAPRPGIFIAPPDGAHAG